MLPQQQGINQLGLAGREVSLRLDTVNATPTGSTDDAVLRFDNATVLAGTGLIAATTTAAAGTTVEVSEPGVYELSLYANVTGAASIAAGIGVDLAAGAPRQSDPAYATAGIVAVAPPVTGVAALTAAITLTKTVVISATQAATAGQGVVYFLATDNADGAPAALVVATVSAFVTKIAEPLGRPEQVPLGAAIEVQPFMHQSYFHQS